MTARVAALTLALSMLVPAGLDAYLQLGFTVGERDVRVRWEGPARWFAAERGVAGVSPSEFQAAVARAFDTWQAVPTASAAAQFVGFTSASPFDEDGLSVFGFESEPGMDRVLGATSFVIDTVTGAIVEADVFFNAAFAWSTAPAGDPARVDVEAVALHEIGHVFGLGHSALGETESVPGGGRRVLGSGAVMFPIALGRGVIKDRVLQPDDIAGISDLYPDGGFERRTGALRGRVRRGREGVVGAHVVAFNPLTGALVGGFALGAGGEFVIAGLEPGAYVVRVEPLDDADIDSFFVRGTADVDFQVTYHDRLAVAPAGGAGASFDVAVRPK